MYKSLYRWYMWSLGSCVVSVAMVDGVIDEIIDAAYSVILEDSWF